MQTFPSSLGRDTITRVLSGVLMRLPFSILLLAGGLAACAPFPELDAVGPDTGPPPQLLPIDDLLQQAQTTSADPGPAVAARAARLKARAAAIKAPPPLT